MNIVPKTTWVINKDTEIKTGDIIKIRIYGDKKGYYLEGEVLFVSEEYIEVEDYIYNCDRMINLVDIEDIIKIDN